MLLIPVSIQRVSVDIVEDYKYQGIHTVNKLNWIKNTTALYRKGQSHLYFLRWLMSFNICHTMIRMFYKFVVVGAILFAVVFWGSRLRVVNAKRLNRLIHKVSDVVGVELDSLTVVSERRIMLSKLHVTLDNGFHPLHDMVHSNRSTFSTRLIPPRCTTEFHTKSFLLVSIKLFCSSLFVSGTLSQ